MPIPVSRTACQCLGFGISHNLHVLALQMVIAAAASGNEVVRQDALRLGQYGPGESLSDAHDLANRIFVSIYMGSENSSTETRKR